MADTEGLLSDDDLAVLAAIDELPRDDVGPALRALLLARAADIEIYETGYLEAVRDSVILASQNLQDQRIAEIVVRLEKLESPPPPTMYETAVDALLILIGELAFIGAPYLVGPVLLLAGGAFRKAGLTRGAIRAVRVRRARLLAGLELAEAETEASVRLWRKHRTEKTWNYVEQDLADLVARQAEVEALRTQAWIADCVQTMHDVAERTGQTAADFLKAGSEKLGSFSNGKLAAFAGSLKLAEMRKELTATAKGRARTAVGTIGKDLSKGQEPLAEPAVLLTSMLTNGLLGDIAGQMEVVRRTARQRQAALLTASEDQLFDSDLSYDILLHAEAARGEMVGAASDPLVREGMVYGAEAYLWYLFLASAGILETATDRHVEIAYTQRDEAVENAVIGDFQLTQGVVPGSLSPGQGVVRRATQYPMAAAIGEERALYLWRRFAGPLIEASADGVRLPPGYATERYKDVLKERPTFLGGFVDNTERQRKIDELRVVVIQAFLRDFAAPASRQELISFVGVAPAPQAAADGGRTPAAPSLEPDPASLEAAHAAFTQFLETGDPTAQTESRADVAMVQVMLLLFDVERQIWDHALAAAASSGEGLSGSQRGQMEQSIRDTRDELHRRLDAMVTSDDPAEVTAAENFATGYEQRLDAIDAWPNTLVGGSLPGFKIFDPVVERRR